MPPGAAPELFDRDRRRTVRGRAWRSGRGRDFLTEHAATELGERLALVERDFGRALLVGPVAACPDLLFGEKRPEKVDAASPSPIEAAGLGGLVIDEDRPSLAENSYDLIIAGGTLDSVADLPGALALFRRALKPDGLFLASLFGAGTLPRLRAAMAAADAPNAVARIHPQVELRQAGDLLQRAGFALPVADADNLDVRYSSFKRLIEDLRAAGAGNVLAGGIRPLNRTALMRALAAWQDTAGPDGRVVERFAFLQLSGWAPSPDQPKPARRGSATVSLAEALRKGSAKG